ncbi:isocitrate lyase/phosphoenolpyruvate mutase family protein [bacterium]|nr:isocitrate lyase/phosphoenolpyruvate mutase family protein [bacterium]
MRDEINLQAALTKEKPLQIVGVQDALHALLARREGVKALYLSGSGVAAHYGLPDLGLTTADDVVRHARNITERVDNLPLLVDIDTGFASIVGRLERSGVAGIHTEDQEAETKRCGHLPGKKIAPIPVMVDRLKAALDARTDSDFMIMARTDAYESEGLAGVIERCERYVETGADALFPEAISELSDISAITSRFKNVPVLINLTEFGRTPAWWTPRHLSDYNVAMVLHPLTIMRAELHAAQKAFRRLRLGLGDTLIPDMMTRNEFYELIEYHKYD